jgi:DNA modification methylase
LIINEIIEGDCLDVMRTFDANSIHCVLTDPPYGLSFMGKDWDHGIPGIEFWKVAYRVMKPGAFLLSFGGTRTFHRLTCAIEDAGFEIRDCMMWLYGSGFPKSHNLKGEWSGWGTALKPAWEPILVCRKPLEGTVAENVLKWGTGGMNIDGGRIRYQDSSDINRARGRAGEYEKTGQESGLETPVTLHTQLYKGETNLQGRWPANVILDEEAGAMLDGQSGELKSGASKISYIQKESTNNCMSGKNYQRNMPDRAANTGGASRFFYCAKTSKRERGEGNNHPTVKPLSLLSYLAKLICPTGGIILDPFMGSGSTGIAARQNGFNFIGIEKEPKYVQISKARLACGPVMAA